MNTALVLLVGLVAGQTPEKESATAEQAKIELELPITAPELSLEGKTDGSAALSVSAGVLIPIAPPIHTLVLRGTYVGRTSNGLAQILSVMNDGKGGPSGTWRIGLTTTLIGRSQDVHELHPDHIVNVGFELGKHQLTYLEDTEAGLTLRDVGVLSGRAGISGAWRLNKLTLEGLANYVVDYQESTANTRWCADTGNVITSPGATTPSQSCTDTALGAATKAITWDAALQVGWVDPKQDKFRVAGRIELITDLTGAGAVVASVPLYFLLAKTSDQKDTSYKGIIQISPNVRLERGPSGGWSLGLTLSLLAQERMFSNRFDSL